MSTAEESSHYAEMVDKDWTAACQSAMPEILESRLREMSQSPAKVLEIQHCLMAVGMFYHYHNRMDAVDALKDAGYVLSLFAAAHRNAEKKLQKLKEEGQ